MSPKRRYLQSVNGNWRYRRRWPEQVTSRAPGTFFIKHLGTSDLTEAIRQRPAVDMLFDAKVAELKQSVDKEPRQLSEVEAITLAGRWYVEAKAAVKAFLPRQLNPEQHDSELMTLDLQLAEFREQLGTGDFRDVEKPARRFLEEQGVMAEMSGPGYRELLTLIVRAKYELAEMEKAWLLGDYSYQPSDQVFADVATRSTNAAPKRTLGDLMSSYRADKEAGWSKSTKRAYGPIWRLLSDTLGDSHDLVDINRPEGRALFDTVKTLPRNLGKRKELRGLNVPDAIKVGKELDLPTLHPKSINDSYMSALNSIFKWAVKEQWMGRNPVDGLRVKDQVQAADKRDPFTGEQLSKIFNAAPWVLGGAPKEKPINYWGPLIALFHGMRRGEIAMLETAFVREVEGRTVMLIQKGKTKNARRMLPVHRELIRMGFIDYIESRRSDGGRQLFEGETENGSGQWGDSLTDWFSRLIRERGAIGNLLGMHALRHNFQDRLREAGLHGTAVGQELAGRSKGGDTSNNYGSGFSTEKLAGAMEKIFYPDLDLSQLYSEVSAAS